MWVETTQSSIPPIAFQRDDTPSVLYDTGEVVWLDPDKSDFETAREAIKVSPQ